MEKDPRYFEIFLYPLLVDTKIYDSCYDSIYYIWITEVPGNDTYM